MTPEMDDEDIERMIDIIGDGELNAEALNSRTGKACGHSMRASGKRLTRPLCSATQMDSLRGLAEAFLKGLLHLITQLYPNPLILRRMRGT
jgi:hypothetical protein